MTRRDLLPSTTTGLLLAVASVVPFAMHLLGEQGARLGAFRFPAFDSLGLAGVLVAAALLAPRSRDPMRAGRIFVRGLLLAVLAWPVMALRGVSVRSDQRLEASSGRAGQERVAEFDLVEASRRLPLRRFSGRRRELGLDITGYLRALEDGNHVFEISSDGRASLSIDGKEVVSQPVLLSRGLHRIAISYQRGAGPPFLDLSWNRPALFEPLPLPFFSDAVPARIGAGSIRWAELGSMVSFAVTLGFFSLLSGLAVSVGEKFSARECLTTPAALVFAMAVLFFAVLFASFQPRDK
ncbi:MAG TPA: PA14 domain-containing protein, partial [Vicinamibacteria bacterium]|nr:PA14 domain-containing protein [Vicinamibacteria bacterium]